MRHRTWSDAADYQELDALVLEELEAAVGRAMSRPARPVVKASTEPPADAFEAPAPEDEESFIERTADYLRGRPDAGALLDAVRAVLAEDAGEDGSEAGDEAGSEDARADGAPDLEAGEAGSEEP